MHGDYEHNAANFSESEIETKNKVLENTAKNLFRHWRSLLKDTLGRDWGDSTNEATIYATNTYSESTFQRKKMKIFSQETLPSDAACLMMNHVKILENLWEHPEINR